MEKLVATIAIYEIYFDEKTAHYSIYLSSELGVPIEQLIPTFDKAVVSCCKKLNLLKFK